MADMVLCGTQVKPLELTGGVILAGLGTVLTWDSLERRGVRSRMNERSTASCATENVAQI